MLIYSVSVSLNDFIDEAMRSNKANVAKVTFSETKSQTFSCSTDRQKLKPNILNSFADWQRSSPSH